jgi:hypothetical protein
LRVKQVGTIAYRLTTLFLRKQGGAGALGYQPALFLNKCSDPTYGPFLPRQLWWRQFLLVTRQVDELDVVRRDLPRAPRTIATELDEPICAARQSQGYGMASLASSASMAAAFHSSRSIV